MPDIPPGWAAIDAALIAAFLSPLVYVLIRILGRLKRVEADTTVTAFHVANEHIDGEGNPINLRDDNDQKHAETMAAVARIGERLDRHSATVEKDIGGIRHELRTLHETDSEQIRQANRLGERLTDLEKTGEHPARRRDGES